MTLHIPHAGGLLDSRLKDIADKLHKGDPIFGWPGDPRLFLTVGSVVHRQTGRVVEQRAEVRRLNEDGQESFIGSWLPHEIHLIISDLAAMRMDSPAYVPTAERIDRHNKAEEKKSEDQFKDHYGAMLEHAASLAHDLNNPKHTFRQVGGRRDD